MGKHHRPLSQRIKEGSIPEPNTGCWLWEGAWDQHKGYGRIKVNGKTVPSHRAAYIAFYGYIPKGKIVLHICNNPSCVNPVHLKAGTQSENIKQMWREGRNHTNWSDASHRKRDEKGRFI